MNKNALIVYVENQENIIIILFSFCTLWINWMKFGILKTSGSNIYVVIKIKERVLEIDRGNNKKQQCAAWTLNKKKRQRKRVTN